MIKILHVLPRMPIGGVGSFLINTQLNIDNSFIFDYLVLENVSGSNFREKVESFGSHVYLMDEKLSLKNTLKFIYLLDKFFSNIGKEYDVIHLHSANICMLVMPIAKHYGVKVRILHAHATQYSDSLLKSIRNYILELPSNLFLTNRIACSKKAGDFQFHNRYYDVVYNGIDPNRFKFKKVDDNKLVVGHVGNFLPQKNHEYLLEVFKELLKIHDDSELWLFGKGPLEQSIKCKADELSISDKIIFWGTVNNIEDYYNHFDVLLLPSLYEGFPVALVEASFCGIPAIVSDTITQEMDILNDISFLPIDNRNVDIWAKKIIESSLYSNKKDRAEAFHNSCFNISSTTKKLEDLYISFISKVE